MLQHALYPHNNTNRKISAQFIAGSPGIAGHLPVPIHSTLGGLSLQVKVTNLISGT
jgi:hypothetical protein